MPERISPYEPLDGDDDVRQALQGGGRGSYVDRGVADVPDQEGVGLKVLEVPGASVRVSV
ncbi:hypothetical protein [Streptomyces alboniger]|uniref:hypothetical protein n=1 Tax=Streptomyces alboniger TaxID=132473 RepID=UPI00123CE90A|nr:hypothetical protein [Streptomyces alboniger]